MMVGGGQGAEQWVACDEDDEVIASVGINCTGGIAYASVNSTALVGGSGFSLTLGAGASRQFLNIRAAQAWVERQLANTYTFPAPTTGWATTVTPLGGTP
jgi:hypothetical protein